MILYFEFEGAKNINLMHKCNYRNRQRVPDIVVSNSEPEDGDDDAIAAAADEELG